jgi:hypothetical protein
VVATQADFWPAVETKMEHAQFFHTRMRQALEPPTRTRSNVALQARGTIIWTDWQRRLFANFDAFLAMARSVPEIIEASFGVDTRPPKDIRRWFTTLVDDEQKRRQMFSYRFAPAYDRFRGLPLSKARNATLHRTGDTGAEVHVTGWFGVSYSGSAVRHVPDTELRPVPPGTDPAMLPPSFFAHPVALEPKWTDFTFEGRLLFDEVREYLGESGKLVNTARHIAADVHGTDTLSTPPA